MLDPPSASYPVATVGVVAKAKVVYRCGGCGAVHAQWAGRCGTCGAWNTLEEEVQAAPSAPRIGAATLRPHAKAVPISGVDATAWAPARVGISEFDRVLAGGLVPGSVTLVGGEPGIGKSTLLLQVLGAAARSGKACLLVSAEESAQQVRLRAERLGAIHENLYLLPATTLFEVLAAVEEVAPRLLVVDSIQTLVDPELGATPGTVGQVRGCAASLVAVAKERAMATILVGHVTKDGSLAGPRVLEHVVDTVLEFEGDRHHALRMLRAVKHRFGATGELGLFEMTNRGMQGVADAARLFLGERRSGVPGSVVLPAMEGARPILVEVQALVAPSNLPQPRRSAQGLDSGRLALLVAVLERRCGVSLAGKDVFASVVGGVKVTEPAADLAVAIALCSAASGIAVPSDVVVCGEVGLAGEIRQVGHLARRLSEAARLGFKRAVLPYGAPVAKGVNAIRAGDLAIALEELDLLQKRG